MKLKPIRSDPTFAAEHARLEQLRAREADAKRRVRDALDELEAVARGSDSEQHRALVADLVTDPAMPVPSGTELEVLRGKYREARKEQTLFADAAKQQYVRVEDLRTRATEAAVRELAPEWAQRVVAYFEGVALARQRYREVRELRDALDEAGFRGSFLALPINALRSVDTLAAELLADPTISAADKRRIAEVQESLLAGVEREREGVSATESLAAAAARREMQKTEGMANLQRR